MNCLPVEEILDLAESGRGHEHLSGCAECRQRFSGIAPAIRLLREAGTESHDAGAPEEGELARRLLRCAASEAARGRPSVRRAWSLAAAASLLLAAGAATAVYFLARPLPIRSIEGATLERNEAFTSPGMAGTVVLDDGTVIRLEAGSRIWIGRAGRVGLVRGRISVEAPAGVRIQTDFGAVASRGARLRLASVPGRAVGLAAGYVSVTCEGGASDVNGRPIAPGETAVLFQDEPPAAGPGAEAERLVEQLSSDSPDVRREARSKLLALGAAALPSLEAGRSHPDPEVRASAGDLADRIHAGILVKRLPEKLRQAHPELGRWILQGTEAEQARALEAMTGVRAHPQDRNVPGMPAVRLKDDRTDGEWALRVAPGVAATVKHAASPKIRRNGLYALRWIFIPARERADLGALARPYLEDGDEGVRAEAIEVLRSAGGDGVEALVARLDDPSPNVRKEAVRTLGERRHPAVVKRAATRCFDDPDPFVRQAYFAVAIAEGPGRSLPVALRALEIDSLRNDACAAVVRWNAPEAIPVLRRIVAKGDPYAYYAVRALGELGATEAVPEILELSKKPGMEKMYGWFLPAYARLGDPRAMPAVRPYLQATDEWALEPAVWAAARLDPSGSREELLRVLDSRRPKDDRVARACVYVLGEQGEPSVRADVIRMATSDVGATGSTGQAVNANAYAFLINRYRKPAEFARLKTAPFPHRFRGTIREAFDAIARASGLALRVDEAAPRTLEAKVDLIGRHDAASALADLVAGPWALGVVLEDGEIGVWSLSEARAKLRAWSLQNPK